MILTIFRRAAGVLPASLLVTQAWAQGFPGKPIRLVVPNAAGGAADLTARAVGQIDAGLDILSPLLAQIKARALHPQAITGEKRSRVLPEVPTAKEAGVNGFVAASWNGLAVPSNAPSCRSNKAWARPLPGSMREWRCRHVPVCLTTSAKRRTGRTTPIACCYRCYKIYSAWRMVNKG